MRDRERARTREIETDRRTVERRDREPELQVPAGDGDDLVGAELQAAQGAGGVACQHGVHDAKQLLDALVLPQVLAALHQEGVVSLVVAPDDQPLGTPDGRHDLHLQGGKKVARGQRGHAPSGRTELLCEGRRRGTYPFVKTGDLGVVLGLGFGPAVVLSCGDQSGEETRCGTRQIFIQIGK